ncbi:MAG: hypothetical protein ABDK87_02775 [Atribacterota bacterium]
MEEERRSRDIVELLRENFAQVDHWYGGEEVFFYRDVGDTIPLAPKDFWESEEWQEFPKDINSSPVFDRIFFVDGKMRIHARILFRTAVLLLGEVAASWVAWEKGKGLFFGFSPDSPPRHNRVLGAGEELALGTAVERPEIDLGMGLVFRLSETRRLPQALPDLDVARQAVLNVMQHLEQEVVRSLLPQGFPVVKDGTIHFIDPPSFIPNVGPCGMVKRVEELRLPPEWLEELLHLPRGRRTPFVAGFLRENRDDVLRIFSYLRLLEDPAFPWKGLVRLEVAVPKEQFPFFREEISEFFDGLSRVLPNLTGDYPWKRLPENLFPIIALEERLSQHFAPSSLVQELVRQALWRGKR